MKEYRSKRLRVWENISLTIREFKVLLLGYRSYTALLTQTGTNPPVATVLENTLGVNITYSYSNVGTYFINSSTNIFQSDNFVVIQGAGNASTLSSLWVYFNSANQLYLECYDLGNVGGGFNLQNGILTNQFIEIRVYN